jgi:hypothetical protein
MRAFLLSVAVVLATGTVSAEFTIDSWTVDGGGTSLSSGGDYTLAGTIGQPDASTTLSGGDYTLTGGFWAGIVPVRVGDLNCDGVVDFFDIDPFVQLLVSPNEYLANFPNCNPLNGDINQDGELDFFDIDPFVVLLVE